MGQCTSKPKKNTKSRKEQSTVEALTNQPNSSQKKSRRNNGDVNLPRKSLVRSKRHIDLPSLLNDVDTANNRAECENYSESIAPERLSTATVNVTLSSNSIDMTILPSTRSSGTDNVYTTEHEAYYFDRIKERQGLRQEASVYRRLRQLGEGAFGCVHLAENTLNGNKVAIKELTIHDNEEELDEYQYAEADILKTLTHPNIIRLHEVCICYERDTGRESRSLVLELGEENIVDILDRQAFHLEEARLFMKQILSALFYMHTMGIVHRDLKPENILKTASGQYKIGDFGSAFKYTPPPHGKINSYFPQMVTLYYRSPELLLGETNYGPAIDMWSIGCVFGELFLRCPILFGNEIEQQVRLIIELCGSLSPDVWPEVTKLPGYSALELPENPNRTGIAERFSSLIPDPLAVKLLESLLVLDPSKRATVKEAVNSKFLSYYWKGDVLVSYV